MVYIIEEKEFLWFPDIIEAEEDGLVAVTKDISVERLQLAYSRGIFPWYESDGYFFWFAPPQRLVLFPTDIYVSGSMKQVFRGGKFRVSFNEDFKGVIQGCSTVPRIGQPGTWISDNFVESYTKLHKVGIAHSVEVWMGEELVGGLYGVEYNGVFSGESMFSRVSNASKTALIWLCKSGRFRLIDCQVGTEHLQGMGAKLISREHFVEILTADISNVA